MKCKRIEVPTGTGKKKIRILNACIEPENAMQKLTTSLGKVTNLKKGDQIELSEGTALLVVENNEILLYCDRPDTYTLDMEAEKDLSSARFRDLKRFSMNYSKFNQSKDLKQKTLLLNLSPMSFRFECNVPVDVRIKGLDLQVRFYGFVTVQICNPFLFLSNLEEFYPKCVECSIEESFKVYKGEVVDLIIEWLQSKSFETIGEIKEKQREMFEVCKQKCSTNPSREKGIRFTNLTLTEILPTPESRAILEVSEPLLFKPEESEENGWDSMF